MHEIFGILIVAAVIYTMSRNNSRQLKNMKLYHQYYKARMTEMVGEVGMLKEEVKLLKNKLQSHGENNKTEQAGKNSE